GVTNVSGQAYGLTVLTPIIPGREETLKQYLEDLPYGAESPFEKTRCTHLARWVIIPQLYYEGAPQKRDTLGSQYLLFESNFDGADLDKYVAVLCRDMPLEADKIWGCCVGYPGISNVDAFRKYLCHNQIDCTFFVAAYPDATVNDVRTALAFREEFTAFAIAAQQLDAVALQESFRAAFGRGTLAPPSPRN
ncbi:MAG TPA: hypothetical protein VIU63_07550, partial [Nitrospira sp.]